MTKIYVVRHAEAEGNLYRRIHGQYESLVTPNGHAQIRALEKRFDAIAVDACYSSDLLRTRVTAQAVYAPKNLPLRLDARFREVHLGVWEDVPFGQLESEHPALMKTFSADPLHWQVEGSETFAQFCARFLCAMDEAVQANANKTIVIFSHGCVIRAMQQRLFFGDEQAKSIGHCDNTGVSLLEYENGQYHAVYLNDNSHLSPEISTLARQKWWRKTGGGDHNLWFRPMADERRYCQCRKDAWQPLHGELDAKSALAFFEDARCGALGEPDALCEAVLADAFAGLVQLDAPRYAGQDVGYISFLYLLPALRGLGLGAQLLGQAVSFYRARGRKKLWLSVSAKNESALRFYRKNGFREVGTADGVAEPLLLLELPIDTAVFAT